MASGYNKPPGKDAKNKPIALPFAELEAALSGAPPSTPDTEVDQSDPETLLEAGSQTLRKFINRYLREEPNWIKLTLWEVARSALLALRHGLTQSEHEEITWEDPVVEVQFPVEWDWEAYTAHTGRLTEEDLSGSGLSGEVTQAFLRHRNLLVLQFLTNRVAYEKSGEHLTPMFLPETEEMLPPESPKRQALLNRLFQPIAVGPNLIELPQARDGDTPDLPSNPVRNALDDELEAFTRLSFEGEAEGEAYSMGVSIQFHPLVVDEEDHRAYYPVVTGLVFTQSGESVPAWPQKQREAIWDEITGKIDERIEELTTWRTEDETAEISATETTGTLGTEGRLPVRVVPPKTFPLPLGPAFIDRETHQVIATTLHTRGLFPRWSDLPVLEDEIDSIAQRIYEEEGLEGLRSRKGGLRAGPEGDEKPYLAADSRTVKELMIELGMSSGYRRRERSPRDILMAGGIREHACRIFQTSRGYIEIGLSWGHLAGPWVDQWHEELVRRVEAKRAQLEDMRVSAAQSLIAEDLDEDIQGLEEVLAMASEAITIWKRGHTLMGLIQGSVFHQKSNWVVIPAEAVRMALWDVEGKKTPANWKRDVDAVLASLATVTFTVRGLDGEKIKGFGHFLGEVWYEENPVLVRRPNETERPAPPQSVPQGSYLLDVQEGFLGCLRVFRAGEDEIAGDVGSKLLFNWSKRLSDQEREVLTGRPKRRTDPGKKAQPYLTFDPARYLAHGAKGLSTTQRALDDCLERELTLNWKGGGGKRRVVANDYKTRERIYSTEECPLLPEGTQFVLAGGNGMQAGQGYTVGGSRQGQHHGGWLGMVGYFSANPQSRDSADTVRQCLKDMETVVEEYYGGVVTGYRDGQWLTLQQLRKLATAEILRANVRPFLPLDYRERRRQAIRDQGIEVVDTDEELQDAREAQTDVDGALVRDARQQRKVTQKDLADMLGISQAMVSQIETGRRPIPEDMMELLIQWLQNGGDEA